MKKLLLFAAVSALGVMTMSCSNEKLISGEEENGGKGALTVSIKGQNSDNPTGRASGNPTQAQENTVNSFTVYVFSYTSGSLEKSETFTGVLTGTMNGLSLAFTKRVVVLVNVPSGFPAITRYSDLTGTTINLDSQVQDANFSPGLFMSGEYGDEVQLTETPIKSIQVDVSRIVAKVRINSLTVSPDPGYQIGLFSLDGVSIQKARDISPVLGGLATSGFGYLGGTAGSISSSVRTYLYEAYNLPPGYVAGAKLEPGIYFYVFPNDNSANNPTLLSLSAEYDGNPAYFSFEVNNVVGTGGDTTDGTWIERNMVYSLDVTLKKLGLGSDDPDVPNKYASLEITITVADWEDDLIQTVEW